jgi:molecular chaperone DnaJ
MDPVVLVVVVMVVWTWTISSQFGDIFGSAFGGGGGFEACGGQRRTKGSNLRIKVKLTLEEIANGVEKR